MSFKIQIQGTDVAFDCAATDNLLDAAMRQGIDMPYSCRKGVCGNCKGRVLQGALVAGTEGGSHEVGITQSDEHLFCRARPASDLSIAPKTWQRVDPAARKTVQAKVFKKIQRAPDVTQLQLRFPAGVRVKFKAGQYLQVVLPDGQRRSYSMANSPHESDAVQLHIRHVPQGHFSEGILGQLQVGDQLTVELPHGDFWLREDSERPMLLVAGGSGITPILSIMKTVLAREPLSRFTLVYGNRMLRSTMFKEEIEDLKNRYLTRVSLHHVFSDDPTDAPLNMGLMNRDKIAEFLAGVLPADSVDQVYICGPFQMNDEAEAALQRQEVAHLMRVSMLGELSGSIAHEVNQPLTAILSNAQAALYWLGQKSPDLDEVRGALGQDHAMHIGGRSRHAARQFELRSPIDRECLLGRFHRVHVSGSSSDQAGVISVSKVVAPPPPPPEAGQPGRRGSSSRWLPSFLSKDTPPADVAGASTVPGRTGRRRRWRTGWRGSCRPAP